MARKFGETFAIIVVTAGLVIVACAIMISHAINQQRAALAPLQAQNDALRSQADENRRDIEETAQVLRQAVSNREGEVFSPEETVQRLNGERLNALADAIAAKVAPKLPAAASPDQVAAQETQAVNRIADATAGKLQPSLDAIASQEQQGTSQEAAATQARLKEVSADLAQTQQAADQALQLSQQLSSMYLNTYKDHGVVVRVLSLPAEIIQDAAGGNVISDRQRKKEQDELNAKLQEIQARLNQIKQQGQPVAANQ